MKPIILSRRSALLSAGVALAAPRLAFAQQQPPAADAAGELFGVIEVGSSGVKPSIVRILGGQEPDLKVVRTITAVEANAVDAENATRVALAVKSAIDAMVAQGIKQDLILVVGSSGVAANAETKAAVAAAIARATGKDIPFVSIDKEVEYTFDGVVNRKRLAHRRTQVTLVDIGSGNTKGGYILTTPGGTEHFQIFAMPLGTKSFARQVQKVQGDDSFASAARKAAEQSLRPAIQQMLVDAGPVIAQRSRIYLNGGLAWAVATTQNPSNPDRYVPLTTASIDRFYSLATTDQRTLFAVDTPALPEAQRTLIQGDLRRLSSGDVFTPDEYVAGAELLHVLSEEMRMRDKTLFFTRPGRVAWIIGLVYDRVADGQIANTVLP